MEGFFKTLYSLRSLGLGWAITWRAFLVILANAVIIGIISAILQNVPAIAGIFNVIASVYMAILSLLATGWAVIRIKDKLR